MNNEICEITCIHEDKVNRAKSKLANFDTPSVSGFFKILSDENRLKIVHALVHEDELCVCDIANVLNMTKSSISHQLAILREAGIVRFRRSGKEVYYTLDDEHISRLYEIGLEHINHKLKGEDYA